MPDQTATSPQPVRNQWTEAGFADRADYLRHLSEEYDVPLSIVRNLAALLGSGEDFDGLVVALEDYPPE